MSLKVEIYGREDCRFSVVAVAYCASRSYPFVYLDLADPAVHAEMLERAPLAVTSPQIFIGPHRIGTFSSLHSKDAIIQQLLGGH